MRDLSLYLKDISQAIESIEAFIFGMDYDAFFADDKTVSAVIRKLEIIGEAVKQLPEEVSQRHPDIQWKRIAGMRDKLVHDYFGVNMDILWDVLTTKLPALLKQISNMAQDVR